MLLKYSMYVYRQVEQIIYRFSVARHRNKKEKKKKKIVNSLIHVSCCTQTLRHKTVIMQVHVRVLSIILTLYFYRY